MRQTGDFAGTAAVYRQARRGYPDELRDHLVARRLARPDAQVMDLGAGTGQLTLLLADVVQHVTAVEPEPDMVRVGCHATGAQTSSGCRHTTGTWQRCSRTGPSTWS